MTSRDNQASYYDLELPDGTRTEVWSVLRAVLTAEETLGYAKGCMLTRIMRDGRKDVDRLREAEKIGVEAGMLREAMEAYLATPDPMTAALDAVDMLQPRIPADDQSDRIAELERELSMLKAGYDAAETDLRGAWRRIEELERERDSARMDYVQAVRERDEARERLDRVARQADVAEASRLDLLGMLKSAESERDERDRWRQTAERAQSDLDALHRTLETELERERDKAREGVLEVQREYNNLFDSSGKEIQALKRTLDTERQAAVATAEELERVRRELAALRDRYRERRQSEEPAPQTAHVMCATANSDTKRPSWRGAWGWQVGDDEQWCYQPPAPGEGG